jgi:hypothetical protein
VLTKRNGYWYGDNYADIQAELIRYSTLNGYIIHHFSDINCACSAKVFCLALDDTVGAAIRSCVSCHCEHPIGDSNKYLKDAALEECACPCGNEQFEMSAGVSVYDDSEDVRWFYLGCRCAKCGLIACYGDWKNEYNGYRQLLLKV